MTAKEAIEIIMDQNNGCTGEIVGAVKYLFQLEVDNVQLQNRCRSLTHGMLCGYCSMADRCENKEGKENGKEA
jgi:hypothetical protein